MQSHQNYHRFFLALILILNVALDQISKYIVRFQMTEYEHRAIIKNFFTLTKVENTGAFLSLGDSMPQVLRLIILTGLPLAFLAYGVFYLFAKPNLPGMMQIALAFLIGGGLGNLYDRVVHGSVTDFMHMNFGIFQTGVFNFADVSIMIGIGLLLLQSFKEKKQVQETTQP